MNDRPRFALRFISGKYQGGEFPLRMNREIIIGRSSDLDMVLVEDMVSRRHAKISSTEAEVYIQDMGSTNGTFVNGEKIAGRALLHEGDRILVCSDGLSGELENDAIHGILIAESDPQAAATRLVHEAMVRGGRDNITALVVDATAVRTRAGRAAETDTIPARPQLDEIDGDTLPRAVATGGF